MTTDEEHTLQSWMLDKFSTVERAQRLQREAIERVEAKQRADNEEVKQAMHRLEHDANEFRAVATDIRDLLEFFKDSRDAINHVAKVTKFVVSKKTWLYAAGVMFVANWIPDFLPSKWPW